MAVVAVYLSIEDIEDDISLRLYDIKDNSIEEVKKFITSYHSGVNENDIRFYLFDDCSVDCATFTTVGEEEFEEDLRWNLEVHSIENLK